MVVVNRAQISTSQMSTSMTLSMSDLSASIAERFAHRFAAEDLAPPPLPRAPRMLDARPGLAADHAVGAAAVAPASDTGTWSLRSFSVTDAAGVSASWTVVGGPAIGDAATLSATVAAVSHPGTPANDVILGGPANDTLAGGRGDDALSGGAGADTFVYAIGDGNDTITDFQLGADRLVIVGAAPLSLASSGATAVLTLPDGAQITLHSATPAPGADLLFPG